MITEAEALPVPDILLIHNQLQAFPGTLPNAGGLLDQPFVLMLELSWCKEGVDRYLDVLRMADQARQGNSTPDTDAARMSQILAIPGL